MFLVSVSCCSTKRPIHISLPRLVCRGEGTLNEAQLNGQEHGYL
jgi:hypothetical protein